MIGSALDNKPQKYSKAEAKAGVGMALIFIIAGLPLGLAVLIAALLA